MNSIKIYWRLLALSSVVIPSVLFAQAQGVRIDDILKFRDTNKDGKISESEAGPMLKRAFKNFDKNADGFIERGEFANFGKARNMKGATSTTTEPDFANLKYGEHERCVMDIWLAESSDGLPTPVVIGIHGGGFLVGDKKMVSRSAAEYLEKGISFVAINYPFKNQMPWPEVFPAALRSIQFLRCHSDQYNIDGERIAMFGTSSGAGITLWAAYHDDLADPDSDDPVARQSSKPVCGVALSTQATYDQLKWHEIVGVDEAQVTALKSHDDLAGWLGIEKSELDTEKGRALRAEIDMLRMIDKTDPPVLLINSSPNVVPGDIVHHPRHSIEIKKVCDAAEVPCFLSLRETPPEEKLQQIDFIVDQLEQAKQGAK